MMKRFKMSGFCLALAVVFVLGISGAVSNVSAAYLAQVQITLNEANMSFTHTTQGMRDRSWIENGTPALADLPLWWSLDGGTNWNIVYNLNDELPIPNFGPLGNAAGDILTIAAGGQQTQPPTPLCLGGDVNPVNSTQISIAWDPYSGSGTTPEGIDWTLSLTDVVTTLEMRVSCPGDFAPSDGDVDGLDLVAWMNVSTGVSLADFAAKFGRMDCAVS
jgi:hypothetical protein